MKIGARAHTNIALIKYWGKRDEALRIPYNSSLSLTLSEFYTDTWLEPADQDEFWLNNELLSIKNPGAQRSFHLLDELRQLAHSKQTFKVTSFNHVPTAAGLASSASAFSALVVAANQTLGLTLSQREQSRYARHGSGSACRSIFGGYVTWLAGNSDETSFAVPTPEQPKWPLRILAVIVHHQPKKISSTRGMALTEHTAPFFKTWVQQAEHELLALRQAMANDDFTLFGQIAEHNALSMHATTLNANPSFTYWTPETLIVWQEVQQLREEGIEVYLTLDAGPNPKLLVLEKNLKLVQQRLTSSLPQAEILSSTVGPQAQVLPTSDKI